MVTSDQRRRQLAREKFERQQKRREEAQRKAKRRTRIIVAAVAVALVAGAGAYTNFRTESANAKEPIEFPSSSPGAQSPEPKADEPKMAVDTKATYTMALTTNRGAVSITMDAAKTPRTVNSFKHLADKKYFDGTKCHRLTTQGIFVLQCGDPKGDGTGGPGYTIPDENLASLGKPGADGAVTYKAGTVAMANTGQPGTGGSQFFLVHKDTKLPPQYTPFGTMDAAALKVVQEVARGGVTGGAQDGAPKKAVTIEKATVDKA
ncbi:peptidylprolyl isomerase [Streptomyces lavendofoliae]|uniref:Peptidyl-prolyl cis-trans isomerase n=1 Tax=Streptomyces lavendofoliae TaxID=67314 RepID=A0A918I274_9ACTN|nr:peptidylprolyl isomerase [Streptomyces lavendofoliae]GGU51578.1 peptidyl-prolyl cis-trans isomerase [Streptomyces lavendofoliae]